MELHYHLVMEQEQPSLSHTYIRGYELTIESSAQTVEDLMDIVRGEIGLLPEFKSCGLETEGTEIRVYQVIQSQ